MNLGQIPIANAARSPEALAFVDGDIRRNWFEFTEEIHRVAAGLRELGLSKGQHCVCIMPNRYETALTFFACQMIGAIFTPFNWRATATEIEFIIKDAEAALIVLDEKVSPAGRQAAENSGIEKVVTLSGGANEISFQYLLSCEASREISEIGEQDTCLMLYTSGTTGRPKGVPRSQSSELCAAMACISQLRFRRNDKSLGVMPLFHTMGIRVLLMSALLGGGWINMRRFDPADALRLISEEEINALFLVPTMYHDIVNAPSFSSVDCSSVRVLAYAGMSMTSSLEGKIREEFSPDVFANYYGSSEIFTFSYCDDLEIKPGSAGWAGMGQVLRVIDLASHEAGHEITDVGIGEVGEVIASMQSPEAFSGYWKRPDADKKAIRDGWYFTGDLGFFDTDGALFLCGRIDDMIISGGENIDPEEVEDVLSKHELVNLVAVVGEADERWGQKVVAYIEPSSSNLTAKELDIFCKKSKLAAFKRPRKYVFVEKIPKSASGKLLRRLLREGDFIPLEGYDNGPN
ncbi:MAG: AMP-binding protein [Rhodospirillaceae bacterium]